MTTVNSAHGSRCFAEAVRCELHGGFGNQRAGRNVGPTARTLRLGSGLEGSSAGAGFAVDAGVAAVAAAGATGAVAAGYGAALGSGRAGPASGACRIGLLCASTRGWENCPAR